jgi:hypothetical protein
MLVWLRTKPKPADRIDKSAANASAAIAAIWKARPLYTFDAGWRSVSFASFRIHASAVAFNEPFGRESMDNGRRQRLPAEQVVTMRVDFRTVAERFASETAGRFSFNTIPNCAYKKSKKRQVLGNFASSFLS